MSSPIMDLSLKRTKKIAQGEVLGYVADEKNDIKVLENLRLAVLRTHLCALEQLRK